jgi:uncharacterized protein YacL
MKYIYFIYYIATSEITGNPYGFVLFANMGYLFLPYLFITNHSLFENDYWFYFLIISIILNSIFILFFFLFNKKNRIKYLRYWEEQKISSFKRALYGLTYILLPYILMFIFVSLLLYISK